MIISPCVHLMMQAKNMIFNSKKIEKELDKIQ